MSEIVGIRIRPRECFDCVTATVRAGEDVLGHWFTGGW